MSAAIQQFAYWLLPVYPWLKVVHIVFVIFWMAGLFMLPRFLAYHLEAPLGSAEHRVWIEREGRLIAIILNPSMVMVWLTGLTLVITLGVQGEGWFHAKFALVIVMTLYQGAMVVVTRRVARNWRGVSGRAMRFANEVPGLLALAIVVLVVVRPF